MYSVTPIRVSAEILESIHSQKIIDFEVIKERLARGDECNPACDILGYFHGSCSAVTGKGGCVKQTGSVEIIASSDE